MSIGSVNERAYNTITFKAVDPVDGTMREDAFYLDELGWSWEQNSDIASLNAFCRCLLQKWAQAMEAFDAEYELE